MFTITIEIFKDILYFPIWWYSRGLAQTLAWIKIFLKNRQESLALFIWVKNIFVPMYGQSDLVGHLISFFIRLVQIIIRGIMMAFWLLVGAFILITWVLLPILVFGQIIWQAIELAKLA